MTQTMHVFGVYASREAASSAAGALVRAGHATGAITVMLTDNQASRDFAYEHGTRAPRGTLYGKAAGEPLEGSLGLMYPGEGPVTGALDGALNGMGVPLEWWEAVSGDKVLLAVECGTAEGALAASGILTGCGAEKTGESREP